MALAHTVIVSDTDQKCELLKLTNSLKVKMNEITVWPLFTQPS